MQFCFWCRSLVPRRPGAPLCGECIRHPSRRLVTLHKALSLGYPLAALRSVGSSVCTGSTTFFLERRLLSAARVDPGLFAPEAARRDLAQLRRDRRAARPAHDSTRAALMRDASLQPWRDGAHVEAVARGLLSRRQVGAVLRTALGASHLSDSRRRPPPGCLFRRAKHADGCVHSRPHRF